jgi:mono/diheme cytochrome c family protein
MEGKMRKIQVTFCICLFVLLAFWCLGVMGLDERTGRLRSARAEETEAVTDKFSQICGACHTGGGNALKPDLPLKEAPQLKDVNTFMAYVRNPKARDGSQTMMPPFSPETLSDEQLKSIYQYIAEELR